MIHRTRAATALLCGAAALAGSLLSGVVLLLQSGNADLTLEAPAFAVGRSNGASALIGEFGPDNAGIWLTGPGRLGSSSAAVGDNGVGLSFLDRYERPQVSVTISPAAGAAMLMTDGTERSTLIGVSPDGLAGIFCSDQAGNLRADISVQDRLPTLTLRDFRGHTIYEAHGY
jgi:hypothetical protein